MPRLLGLAYASKIYRHLTDLDPEQKFSKGGREIAFGTIGDASTSEGLFWEVLNAGGVLALPMVISVWDDGYGISVPKKYQTTHASISKAAAGFAAKSLDTEFWKCLATTMKNCSRPMLKQPRLPVKSISLFWCMFIR